jgi:hypothetical protein
MVEYKYVEVPYGIPTFNANIPALRVEIKERVSDCARDILFIIDTP